MYLSIHILTYHQDYMSPMSSFLKYIKTDNLRIAKLVTLSRFKKKIMLVTFKHCAVCQAPLIHISYTSTNLLGLQAAGELLVNGLYFQSQHLQRVCLIQPESSELWESGYFMFESFIKFNIFLLWNYLVMLYIGSEFVSSAVTDVCPLLVHVIA